jgi:hypothetical protein
MPAVRAKGQRNVASWIRLVLVFAIVLTVCFPILLALAWLDFAGGRRGWIPSVLAFSALGFVGSWVAVSKRWRVARRRTSIGLAALGAIIGIAVAHSAPPTPGRLRHEIEVFVRPGWHLMSDTVEGNATCFDSCTLVTREYRVEANADDVLEELRPVLASHGLQFTPALSADPLEFAYRGGGDVHVRVDIARDSSVGTVVNISAEAN